MQNLCLITDVYRKNCCLHNNVLSPACRIDLMSHKPSDEKVSALLDIGQLNSLIMNCSFSTGESSCSESGVGSTVLPLLACKRDMSSHLVSLGISGKRGRGEAEVSESGAGE